MKQRILLIFIFFTIYLNAQDPFIVTTEGVGQYGYIDADAVSYTRISSNSHGNIERLAARWWADNSEWVYETGTLGCGGGGTLGSTSNFSHGNLSNWDAGENAFVSIYARYCSNTWSQTGTGTRPDGQTGFNERQFKKIDVNTSGSITLSSSIQDNINNVVGTFVINAGSEALTLDRLWIVNKGTAEEVNDIPNDGIRIYYEAATGSEEFDGTENNAPIFGDYGGNSTSNKEFGSDDLNIPISSDVDLRCYIVITDLNDTYTAGRNAQFSILNDGISFQETLDGSFNLMRIDEMDISGSPIDLPVEFTKFTAKPNAQEVLLNWQTATEENNSHFVVEQSNDGKSFRTIGEVAGAGTTFEVQNYRFVDEAPMKGMNYYRLKQVDFDGRFEYSDVVAVDFKKGLAVEFFPNPVANELTIRTTTNDATIQIYGMNGQLIRQMTNVNIDGQYQLDLSDLANGMYQVQLIDARSQAILTQQRVVKK